MYVPWRSARHHQDSWSVSPVARIQIQRREKVQSEKSNPCPSALWLPCRSMITFFVTLHYTIYVTLFFDKRVIKSPYDFSVFPEPKGCPKIGHFGTAERIYRTVTNHFKATLRLPAPLWRVITPRLVCSFLMELCISKATFLPSRTSVPDFKCFEDFHVIALRSPWNQLQRKCRFPGT